MLQISNGCIKALASTIIENLPNVTHEVCKMKRTSIGMLRAWLALAAVLALPFSLSNRLNAQFTPPA
jgi:hypothetical protein